MNNYSHVIFIDESSRELVIYRLDDSGVRTIFTRTPLPVGSGWTESLESFAKTFGENLLLDSPSARQLLNI